MTPPDTITKPNTITTEEFRQMLRTGQAKLSRGGGGKKQGKPKKTEKDLTELFWSQLALCWPNPPELAVQHCWAKPERDFRADLAHLPSRLLIELDGGIFCSGAHGSVSGILNDIDRAQWAAALGWRVFRLSTKDMEERPAQCFDLLRRATELKTER